MHHLCLNLMSDGLHNDCFWTDCAVLQPFTSHRLCRHLLPLRVALDYHVSRFTVGQLAG